MNEIVTPDMIRRVMAELGRRKSPAKTAAARANAKRPRPNARGKRKQRKVKHEELNHD